MKKWLFCVLAFLCAQGVYAQMDHPPQADFIYDDATVPRIDISISEADLALLEADPWADTEYPAQFSFTRETVTEILDSVGIRYRGNTSRNKLKKSYRLSFDTFMDGRAFHGVEKLNLNSETNDPSMVRSKLSWHMFRYLGLPACRENHVLLYINDSFYGVYNNTEHIDDKFVRSRFGKNDGNLYKCLWPADMGFQGTDGDDYKIEHEGRRVYDLKINEEWDDYQDLADMVSALHEYSGDSFREEFEQYFNVQAYLKTMAVDVMTGNWDGYIGNMNNYYLYRDPLSGRLEYIPYDLDNTFGIDWLGEDWSTKNIYKWNREYAPLYTKILEQDIYKLQFTACIKELAAYLTSEDLEAMVRSWHSAIDPWIGQDPFYPLDRGFTLEDFRSSLENGHPTESHIPYGVLEYTHLREASALSQSMYGDAFPMVSYARFAQYPDSLVLYWQAEDDETGFFTGVEYRMNEGEWIVTGPLEASGTDPVSGIGSYVLNIPVSEEGSLECRISVKDSQGQLAYYPEGGMELNLPKETGPALLNEFMASNSSSVADEYGEYDDWVEIINMAAYPVNLNRLYLSDNRSDPGKYRFPEKVLAPGAYYLVWLDDDPEQGENHASFKISRDGEALLLTEGPSLGFEIMDSLHFGEQASDVSMGRMPDGGEGWAFFSMSTPGYSNLRTGFGESLAHGPELKLWPNPVSDGVVHFSRTVSGTVYGINGQAVLQISGSLWMSVESLAPGIYLFRSSEAVDETLRFIVGGY